MEENTPLKESKRQKRKRLVVEMDSQAVQAAQDCKMKYFRGHIEHLVRLRAPRRQDGVPIAVNTGTLIHEMMFHMNRLKIAKANGRFTRFSVSDAQLLEVAYRVIRRFPDLTPEERLFHTVKFTEFFAWDKTQGKYYKPLGSEVGFAKVIYEDADVIFVYTGRIDLVLRAELNEGQRVFNTWADYKSTARDTQLYPNRNQFLGYSWVMDSNMGLVLKYGLQTEKKNPFEYKVIYHPTELIAQWRKDTIDTFRFVLTRAPLGEKEFPRNRAACDAGQYGWCPFVMLCDNAHAPKEVQAGLRRTFYKERVWSPWK